uniref:ZM domain-containing protein n=1 Tax=Caenorhabditis tropicalis TaxID=1561998 RepID=A0A1I7U9U3_9PELO
MSFAKSFYADQKKVEQPQQEFVAVSPAIPATTPIAEDPLTPAQIQEAIRIYRQVISSSAPASPVRPSPTRHSAAPVVPERPQIHSNYYGGGPTDIPQSYLLNYTTSVAAPVSAPPTQAPEEMFTEQQLMEKLQALKLQQAAPEPVYEAGPVQQQKKVVPKKAPVLQKMYDDEESGYCFNRKNKQEEIEEEIPEAHVATPTTVPQANYSAPQGNFSAPVSYSPAPVPNNYSKMISVASEYIGMANDNKFIYDAQKSLPVSYTQNQTYTLVNANAPVMAPTETHETDQPGMTTEDFTQVPESPAVTSRFRGMIRNAQTPIQSTAPIVVERIAEPTVNHVPQHTYNNYGAFMPVNQMSMESEYQLPVLNDLASCIEHY